MSRRFGYWIVGTTLGLTPVAGCAHWGQSSAISSQSARESKSAVAVFVGPEKPIAQAARLETSPAPLETTMTDVRLTPVGTDQPRPRGEQRGAAPRQAAEVKRDPAPAETPPAQRGANAAAEREPLVDALRCVLENRPSEALQFLRNYDRSTQETFLRLLPVLSLLTQKGIDQMSPPEVAGLNEQLQSLAATIRPFSQLVIDEACFCEWIESFGIYKRLPDGHAFLGSDKALLYVELSNFASVFKDGYFTTDLKSSLELRDQKGVVVWSWQGFPEEKEPIRSWKLLRDYHNKILIPMRRVNVPAGTYQLTIQITDRTLPNQSPRVARKTIELRVATQTARQ